MAQARPTDLKGGSRTHTGRRPLPNHPWQRGYDPVRLTANRRRRAAQGMAFSRSSKG